jgi:hypothetical protein
MSVPGVNLEDDAPEPQEVEAADPIEQPQEAAAPAVVEDDDDDALIQGVTQAGSDKEKALLSSLITYRRQARDNKKALEQERTARQALDGKVNEIMPWVEQLRANPKLIEQAQKDTRPSAPATVQPEDDQEAIQWAQDYGLITATGELDITRARRQLNHIDARAERQTQAALAPLRQTEASRAAQQHMDAVRRVTLPDGSRLASDESINEAYGVMRDAPQMLADPNVAAIMSLVAAGLDLAKGRRTAPSARVEQSDPLLTEAPGGGRRAAPVSTELSRIANKMGLTDAKIQKAQPIGARGLALED